MPITTISHKSPSKGAVERLYPTGKQLEWTQFVICQQSKGKFSEEEILLETPEYLIALEGVVLNQQELMGAQDDWGLFFLASFKKDEDAFFSQLRGSFSGIIIDKKTKKTVLFSDQINSKPWFYYISEEIVVTSNTFPDLVKTMKRLGKKLTLCTIGAYQVLTFGYTVEGYTLFDGLKRTLNGEISEIDSNNKITVRTFHKIDTSPTVKLKMEEAVEEVDRLFRQAIRRAFEKDRAYGYKHFCTLSGGLDSRMTVVVAHQMGYTDQLNGTFSKSDYWDEKTPKKITRDLGHEWIFKSLDNGNYLKNIRESIELSGGNALYSTMAHGTSLMQLLDLSKYGIIHTGQLGDIVISDTRRPKEQQSYLGLGANDQTLIGRLSEVFQEGNYSNSKEYLFRNRYFCGTNSGLIPIQEKTETYSPFYDIDLLDFALKIPFEIKSFHKLYFQWINTKYPLAANYVWETAKTKINRPFFKVNGKRVYHTTLMPLIKSKLASVTGINFKSGVNSQQHMNPYDYWHQNNKSLQSFLANTFDENIDRITNETLRKDCELFYHNNNTIPKTQVLTVLGALAWVDSL